MAFEGEKSINTNIMEQQSKLKKDRDEFIKEQKEELQELKKKI